MKKSIVDMRSKKTRQLDRRAQPDEQITEADAADVPKLARLLSRILADVAELKRLFRPRETTFVNVDVGNDGTTVYRLVHRFGTAVDWSVVGWRDAADVCRLIEDPSTDANTLVLVSQETGTADIRVSERG